MTLSQLLPKRKSRLQFAKHPELPDILNEQVADAIVAEILQKQKEAKTNERSTEYI